MISFGNRLAIYGWTDREVMFNQIMIDIWKREYEKRFRNVEQLLFEPLGAIKYCEDVRMMSKIWLPYNEILQQLMNLRKRKLL